MCNICSSPEETKHYSLYVTGSEGVNLCNACQIAVCEFIRRMSSACNRQAIQTAKIIKFTK